MRIVYINSARKILQHKSELEKKLNVKIKVQGTKTEISGKEIDEYFAERVIKAMDFPFLFEQALVLKDEEFIFEVIHIKEHTRRRDLKTIKARIIGKKGKTLKILQDLSKCLITLKGNEVAIIGEYEEFERAHQAVISLIQGSKQGNVYEGLERKINFFPANVSHRKQGNEQK